MELVLPEVLPNETRTAYTTRCIGLLGQQYSIPAIIAKINKDTEWTQ